MTEQTLSVSAGSEKIKEGFWEGRRGRSNKSAIVSTLAMVAIAGAVSQIDFQPAPDDLEHANFLTTNYSEIIESGISSPGERLYILPDHLVEAGEKYATHLETQSEIQATHEDGNRDADVAAADVLNAQASTDAREVFRQGADGSGSGEIVVSAIRCDVTDQENTYDCRMTRAEIGGFDDKMGGLEACERITDRFTVTASIDGAIEYLRTAGPGYSSAINFDLEAEGNQSLMDRVSRHFAAYVTGDFAYYGAQENPQERDAFMEFSGCLVGGPQ